MKTFCSVPSSLDARKSTVATLCISLALMHSPPAKAAQPTLTSTEGVVVRVVDGDTLVFLSTAGEQQTLRLAGIDAPEKCMAYGGAAKRALADLVSSGKVTVQTTKADRYGRSVAKVLRQGEDISLRLIKGGMAWHYKRYVHEQTSEDAENYATSEKEARASRRGLWQDPTPMPPWIYRKCRAGRSDCKSN